MEFLRFMVTAFVQVKYLCRRGYIGKGKTFER